MPTLFLKVRDNATLTANGKSCGRHPQPKEATLNCRLLYQMEWQLNCQSGDAQHYATRLWYARHGRELMGCKSPDA